MTELNSVSVSLSGYSGLLDIKFYHSHMCLEVLGTDLCLQCPFLSMFCLSQTAWNYEGKEGKLSVAGV